MRLLNLTAVTLVTTFSAATAIADIIQDQLSQVGEYFYDNEDFVGNEIHERVVESGQEDAVYTDGRAGTEYLIAGACDEGCTDVDLRIYEVGGSGSPLAEDLETDDRPLVQFDVETDGQLAIVIRMVECDVACRAGVLVMRRR